MGQNSGNRTNCGVQGNGDADIVNAIPGWDKNAITDIAGASLLISWLCGDTELRFFPDIKFADKFPVLDGSIMLGKRGSDGKIHSASLVEVQVKSTTQSIDNDNKSGAQSVCKFDCPVSILNATLAKISRNPIVLIVVDVINSKMYRKILTREYVESLKPYGQTTKTIYFDCEDELADHTKFFNELAGEDEGAEIKYDLALNHQLVCPYDISANKLEELDGEVARLNQLCDTKFYFLKRWSFEDVWKVGLLYGEEDDKYSLALVAMRRGGGNYVSLRSLTTARDVSYLKNFPLGPGVNDDAHFAVTFNKSRPFSEAVDKLLNIWCKAFTETWFVPPEAMSDDVICEVAYYYLDHLAQWVPQLRAEEHPTRFAENAIDANRFQRYVDAVYYSFEKHHLDLMTRFGLPHEESTVYLCETPKKREVAPDWFIDGALEYINAGFAYEPKLNLQVKCEYIAMSYVSSISREACARGMQIERVWKLSPLSVIEAKNAGYQPNPDEILHHHFDYWDTKADYIANYKKFVTAVGSSRELAATVFFGEHGASSVPRHMRECTLYINDHQAQFRALEYGSDVEDWTYCGTEPYADFKPYTNDELESAYKKYGNVTGYNTDPPAFAFRLPLLGAIEDFLLEGAKRLVSEHAVRRHVFPEEPKRKEHMSYTVSYDLSPAQDEENEASSQA